MQTRLSWAILGCGNIAHQFAADVTQTNGRNRIRCAASRSHDKARHFADLYGIERSYDNYRYAINDHDVDVVYIALPNHLHFHWTTAALNAGKHVLCEKPVSMNAQQASDMYNLASRNNLVLIEAFMYRCHPLTQTVIRHIRSGDIGRLQLIRSSFCYRTRRIDNNIRFSTTCGGGALMDVGCYCIDLSCLLADDLPTEIHATGRLHNTGVDELTVGSLKFHNGLIAEFVCGLQVQTNNTLMLCGTDGFIEVPVPWKPPVQNAQYTIATMTPPRQDKTTSTDNNGSCRTCLVNATSPLYGMEAEAYAATILDNAHPMITPVQSIRNMKVLDNIRKQLTDQNAS